MSRNAADALVRYHVHGAQFTDERIATWTADSPGQPTGSFTYYLVNANYSVAGTGNADGSVLTRLDYSATGDFAGGGSPGTWYAHDADGDVDVDAEDFADFQFCFGHTDAGCRNVHDVDAAGVSDGQIDLGDYESFHACCAGPDVSPGLPAAHDWEPDGDVDLADWAEFQVCFATTDPACLAAFDVDAGGQSNGVINLADLAGFERRFNGPDVPPGGTCPLLGSRWAPRAAPASGTFTLHGRPIDVLSDGLVLMDFRARVYLPTLGRWLQRDPTGYTDGSNLYESFRANPGRFTDPDGKLAQEVFNLLLSGRFLSNEEIERALKRGDITLAQAQSGLLLDLRNAAGVLGDPTAMLLIPRGFQEGYRQPAIEATTERFESFIAAQVEAGTDIEDAAAIHLLTAMFLGDVTGVTQLGEGLFAVDLGSNQPLSTGEAVRRSVQGGSTIVLFVAGPEAMRTARARSAVVAQARLTAVTMAEVSAAPRAGEQLWFQFAEPAPVAVRASPGANLPVLVVDYATYPELADNIWHAQKAGRPRVLTYGGEVVSGANRAAALRNVPKIVPFTRDEYPFASTYEGGAGAWVGHIRRGQNEAQGGLLKALIQNYGLQPGDQFWVQIVNHPRGP